MPPRGRRPARRNGSEGKVKIVRKHVLTAALLTVLLLWGAPFAAAAGTQDAPAEPRTHESYLSGSPDGLFYPESELTRAELAQLLSRLVEAPDGAANGEVFSDVTDGDWYASAVRTVAALGMMEGEDGKFEPNAPVSRAACASALLYFLPEDSEAAGTDASAAFLDVPETYWAYEAIERAARAGLFHGDENGAFRPEEGLRRCEAAAVFNRLLGRTPDMETLATAEHLQIFPDVPRASWAYGDIMEAANAHEAETALPGGERWVKSEDAKPIAQPDGFYRVNGALYCVRDGHYLYDVADGVFTFDRDGRYTTGDAALDRRLNELVETYAAPVSGRVEKLRVLYEYVRDNYTYLKQPLVEAEQTGWEPEYATFFLDHGKGNCFNFSATYCLLCRELGEDAVPVVGLLGKRQTPHGWVLMQLDGVPYMFDPQLEWRYLHDYKRTGYDLFMVRPDEAVFDYVWQSVQPE